MNTKLLARFRTKIDFTNFTDWTTSVGAWEVKTNTFDNRLSAFHIGGSSVTTIRNLNQYFEVGRKYRVTFTVSDMTQGKHWIKISNSYSTQRTTNGTFTEVLTCNYKDYIYLGCNELFNGGFSNIQIEELGYSELDIMDDSMVLINKSIADIRDIDTRFGSSSKEFYLSDTSNNRKFFKYASDINQNNVYNANAKIACIVMQGDQNVLEGFLQLTNIIKNDIVVTYKCVVYGGMLDLYQELKNKKLAELESSNLNHSYNVANQLIDTSNVVYPVMDWGHQLSKSKITNHGDGGLRVDHTYGCVKANWIFDKIHSEAGIDWESDIFESSHFDKIVVPINKWEHESDWKYRTWTNAGFSAAQMYFKESGVFGLSSTIVNPTTTYYNYWRLRGDGIRSSLNDFNWNNGSLNCWNNTPNQTKNWFGKSYKPAQGIYTKLRLNFTCTLIASVGSEVDFIVSVFDGRSDAQLSPTTSDYSNNGLLEQKTFTQQAGAVSISFETDNEYYIPANVTGNYNDGVKFLIQTQTAAGAQKACRDCTWTVYNNLADISDRIAPSSYITNMTQLLPDVSQSEFLKSLMKMFNVYADYDSTNEKMVYRTYDTFYSTGSTHDWSDKLDYDSEIDYQLISELSASEYLFTHEKGKDYYSEEYEKANEVIWGEYNVLGENEFIEDSVKDVKSGSISTVLGGFYMNNYFMFISELKKQYPTASVSYDVGLRFLYCNEMSIGSYPTSYFWRRDEQYDMTYHTSYIYAGHLLVPDNNLSFYGESTNYDLNYGQVNHYYPTYPHGETNNNLYNLYWRNYVENLSSKDSKLVTAYFKLNEYDMANFVMNDNVLVDNTYYYVNKIIDYHPDQLTKVELVKLDDISIDFDITSDGTQISLMLPQTSNQVVGSNNRISLDSDTNIILGNNNIIGNNSFNNRIYGDNNIIGDNINNCVIDNSNNVTIGSTTQTTDTQEFTSGTTYVASTYDAQFISIKNSSYIEIENDVSYLDIKTSSNIVVKGGLNNTTIDSEKYRTFTEKDNEATIIRGTKVIGGEIVYEYGGINDPGEDVVQKPFSNAIVNDRGENAVWSIDWVDGDVLNDPGENAV